MMRYRAVPGVLLSFSVLSGTRTGNKNERARANAALLGEEVLEIYSPTNANRTDHSIRLKVVVVWRLYAALAEVRNERL